MTRPQKIHAAKMRIRNAQARIEGVSRNHPNRTATIQRIWAEVAQDKEYLRTEGIKGWPQPNREVRRAHS